MDAFDFLVLFPFALLAGILMVIGFWAGCSWEKGRKAQPLAAKGAAGVASIRRRAKLADADSSVRDRSEIIVNPQGIAFHKRGCIHIGKAARVLQSCRHCMPTGDCVASRPDISSCRSETEY